jgi:oligoribonuclease
MSKLNRNLVWLDLEATGLDPLKYYILEIGVIITDSHLKEITKPFNIVINYPESILEDANDWVKEHLSDNGLFDEVRNSDTVTTQAEKELIKFISPYVEQGEATLCGNSIYKDRSFLVQHMPDLENWFSYRMIDVTSIKELFKIWNKVKDPFKKDVDSHRAISDIKESIAELRFYRENFFDLNDE